MHLQWQDKRPRSCSSAARCLRPACSFTSSISRAKSKPAKRRRASRYLLERKEATYENLRDLNFEYKAGKLSEQDYAVQRASLEDEAAAILAEIESIEKARAVVRHGTRRAGVQNGGRGVRVQSPSAGGPSSDSIQREPVAANLLV